MSERKTFVFTIHAMSYHRMVEKVEEGLMPNFERLMDRGSYGISKSVFSTASAVDYTSMMTGSTHDTHGIEHFQSDTMEGFFFAHYPRDGRLESVPPKFWDKTRLYTHYDVEVPWVWEYLEDQRAIQMGLFTPTTFPAPELPNDGIWVTGYWAKNDSTYLRDHVAACNDQEIREQLLDIYPDYQLTPLYTQPPLYPKGCDNQKDYHDRKLENALEHSEGLQKARFEIFKQEDWDIFLTEDGFCDLMQHVSWPRSKDNPLYDEEIDPYLEKKGHLDQFYQHLDDMLGMYMEELPEDANIILISAHGHEEIEYHSSTHDVFLKFYDLGKFDVPPGWEIRQDKPEWAPPNRSNHNYDGMYIVAGPDFRETEGEQEPISCMDFTPMMMQIYGEQPRTHMDGEIPEHIMEIER